MLNLSNVCLSDEKVVELEKEYSYFDFTVVKLTKNNGRDVTR